jgi:hypothetical protein
MRLTQMRPAVVVLQYVFPHVQVIVLKFHMKHLILPNQSTYVDHPILLFYL